MGKQSDDTEGRREHTNLDSIVAEYYQKLDRGERVDVDQFLKSHPEFEAELKEFFAAEEMVANRTMRSRGMRHDGIKDDQTFDSENESLEQYPETRSHDSLSSVIGKQIGPYRILEELGEGGMGTVYLAEQRKPVMRRDALKIIKPGMDTGQVIARFEAERQALAMMDHSNIAKVFEAGSTDSGRPYFVMELVQGTADLAFEFSLPELPSQRFL
ncbi:protein kinase [Saprospiraceae bacterium]|nr:protein kinase [Saprospiraceae bacterium]